VIPSPKGFLGNGQPTGLPTKPDLSRCTEPSRYKVKKTAPPTEPEPLPVKNRADTTLVDRAAMVPFEPAQRIKRSYRAPPKPAPLPSRSAPVRCGTTRSAVLEVLYEQRAPIGTEALALECWRRWPKWFGMHSHPEFPCTNSVYAKLAALTTDGYVTRPSVGEVRITAEGACAYMQGSL
jgi:hypothetical protein